MPCDNDKVAAAANAGSVQSKRLAEKPLGSIPVDGPAKGPLACNDTEPQSRGGALPDPHDHQFPDNVGPVVKNRLEITGEEKPRGARKSCTGPPLQWWRT